MNGDLDLSTLDRAHALEWIEALESGRYPQGQKRLRSIDNRFCCLGVGCEVAGIKARLFDGDYFYSGQEVLPPPQFVDWLGARLMYSPLVDRNDGTGDEWEDNPQTFTQIAAYLRDLFNLPKTDEASA